jgi:hypothetical protein
VIGNITDESLDGLSGLSQAVQPRLQACLANSSRNNGYLGGAAVAKLTCDNTSVVGKHFGVPQIVDMALGSTPVTVNQNNFGRESGHQQRVSSGRTDESSADDRNPRNPGSNPIVLHRRAMASNIERRHLHVNLQFEFLWSIRLVRTEIG